MISRSIGGQIGGNGSAGHPLAVVLGYGMLGKEQEEENGYPRQSGYAHDAPVGRDTVHSIMILVATIHT